MVSRWIRGMALDLLGLNQLGIRKRQYRGPKPPSRNPSSTASNQKQPARTLGMGRRSRHTHRGGYTYNTHEPCAQHRLQFSKVFTDMRFACNHAKLHASSSKFNIHARMQSSSILAPQATSNKEVGGRVFVSLFASARARRRVRSRASRACGRRKA